MRRMPLLLAISLIFFGAFAVPAFAQSEGEFYNALQDHLPRASGTRSDLQPVPGSAERVNVSSTPSVDVTSSYLAYDAGKDWMSGYLAAGALVVAVLIVGFAVGFVVTHRHHSSNDQS